MKVIIADSNELIRVGIRTILNSDKTLEIVSEARNSEELLSEIQNFGTDIILIDYTSPGFTIDIIPSVLYMYRLNILFRLRINYITNMFIS